MVGWFDNIANAVANIMSISVSDAGWILGLATIIALMITITAIMSLGLKRTNDGINLVIPAGIGVVFVSIVGWWPIWAIIVMVIIMVVVFVGPFSGSD